MSFVDPLGLGAGSQMLQLSSMTSLLASLTSVHLVGLKGTGNSMGASRTSLGSPLIKRQMSIALAKLQALGALWWSGWQRLL